nr:ubiquitin-conjugating enzyme E2 Z-like [Rhipicephalus microplus]
MGPECTPYEGGFSLRDTVPARLTDQTPRVLHDHRLRCVRFNPNCTSVASGSLSILGTWTGPAWSPLRSASPCAPLDQRCSVKTRTTTSRAMKPRGGRGSKRYNLIVQHETIRVAVRRHRGLPQRISTCPAPLREVMLKTFPDTTRQVRGSCRVTLCLSSDCR